MEPGRPPPQWVCPTLAADKTRGRFGQTDRQTDGWMDGHGTLAWDDRRLIHEGRGYLFGSCSVCAIGYIRFVCLPAFVLVRMPVL